MAKGNGFTTVWDAAGVERCVRRVDAREIVEAGGSNTAPATATVTDTEPDRVTSPEVAAIASEILRDPESTDDEKTVAASALSQASPKRSKKAVH